MALERIAGTIEGFVSPSTLLPEVKLDVDGEILILEADMTSHQVEDAIPVTEMRFHAARESDQHPLELPPALDLVPDELDQPAAG